MVPHQEVCFRKKEGKCTQNIHSGPNKVNVELRRRNKQHIPFIFARTKIARALHKKAGSMLPMLYRAQISVVRQHNNSLSNSELRILSKLIQSPSSYHGCVYLSARGGHLKGSVRDVSKGVSGTIQLMMHKKPTTQGFIVIGSGCSIRKAIKAVRRDTLCERRGKCNWLWGKN